MPPLLSKSQAQTWQEHIETLALELNCITMQAENMPGMMFVEEEPPRIEGPIIREQKHYYTMLHELGHVAHGHTQGRPPYQDKKFYFENGVLKSEAQAWEWAMDHALDEPNSETRAFMWNYCMGSYHQAAERSTKEVDRLWNGNRHHVAFKWDWPDDYFWSIKARMLGKEEKVA